MKIGILGCFYGCADMLPEVLSPWLALKDRGMTIVISAINAQFKEYGDIGFPNDDVRTRSVLEAYRDRLDFLSIVEESLTEHDVRSRALAPLLESGVDVVWLLDGDELYTVDEIERIIAYVEQTSQFDYYHVYFDNLFFDTKHSGEEFFPPRIIRTDRRGAVRAFSWDNEISYGDGGGLYNSVPGIVPKRIAHIRHRTWHDDDGNLSRKIAYQKAHFGYCMFRLGDDKKPAYDPHYFHVHGISLPEADPGHAVPTRRLPMLDVIMRTHALGNLRSGISRVSDVLGEKEELSLHSLHSLVQAMLVLMRHNDVRMRLTIIDDRSSEAFCRHLKYIAALCPFEVTLVSAIDGGNAASVLLAFERGKRSGGDTVYFVEDDYLHEQEALVEMFYAHRHFTAHLGGRSVALFPVDYPDLYTPQALQGQTRVVLGRRRHWRVIDKTTGTFFVPVHVLRDHWKMFMHFCENDFVEETSLNEVWKRHVLTFSPIPTLAVHVHDTDTLPPFSDWKTLWDAAIW